MENQFRPNIPFASDMKIDKKDIQALKELSKHVDALLHLMEEYRNGTKDKEAVKKAFAKILEDAESSNKLEKHLASYIVNELKHLQLNMEWNHQPQTGSSFLRSWIDGKIKDEKVVEKGCKGLCSPAASLVIRSCKPDLILKEEGNR